MTSVSVVLTVSVTWLGVKVERTVLVIVEVVVNVLIEVSLLVGHGAGFVPWVVAHIVVELRAGSVVGAASTLADKIEAITKERKEGMMEGFPKRVTRNNNE